MSSTTWDGMSVTAAETGQSVTHGEKSRLEQRKCASQLAEKKDGDGGDEEMHVES